MYTRPDCHVVPTDKPVDEHAVRGARTVRLAVDGIGCERCAIRVRNALLALDAVIGADVAADSGEAVVTTPPRYVDLPGLLAAVAGAGNDGRHRYTARVIGIDGS